MTALALRPLRLDRRGIRGRRRAVRSSCGHLQKSLACDGLRGNAPSAQQATWETYVYDAHGHRSRTRRSDGSTRYQVYSRAGQLLYTEDSRNTNTGEYDWQRSDFIHLGNKLIAQRGRPLTGNSQNTRYHHTDLIQSAAVETNSTGATMLRAVRMPYGSPYDGQYREGPGFAGHVTDTQTNLTYMQQRYYDPVALRFLSPDPVDVSGTDGANFNRYWYANDNPLRFVDPDGREVRIVGSDEFVKRIESQISAADAASPKIAEMTRSLRASPNIHEIRDLSESPINKLQSHNIATDPSAESNGVGTGSTTYMNSLKTTSGDGVKSSPTENLVHELTHAWQNDTGALPDRNRLDPTTGNPASEQPALDMQNEYRRGIGETKMREKY